MTHYISQIFYILGEQRKKIFLILLSFGFVSSVEALGIGLIGPFISLATKPEIIKDKPVLELMYKYMGFDNEKYFIAAIGFIIIFIFCLKSFLVWRVKVGIYTFSSQQQVSLREKLMNAYLEAPYTFHLKKNSAHIINNILSETFKFSQKVLNPLLELVANTFIVISLVTLLCFVNPVTIGAVLLIFLPLFILFSKSKTLIARWGKESSDANQEIVRAINHGLGGIKETKVLGCGSYFREELLQEAERFAISQKQFYNFSLTPRIIIETLLVVFLVGFTSLFILLGRDTESLIALLSVFAIASMRLIPAASQIMGGISFIKNSSYTVQKLYHDLKELDRLETNLHPNQLLSRDKLQHQLNNYQFSTEFSQQIEIQNINYSYPNSQELSLKNLSLKIKKGESIALIGKSGAGKTSLVDVILGLLIPQSGDIKVDGKSIYSDLRSWQNLIGYIPQSIFLIEDTIEKNIAFGIPDRLIDRQKLWQAIKAAQLADFVNDLPQGIHTVVGERGSRLSGGQRQRIGIARALYYEREILVLDEATAALDNETEFLVTKSIEALSKSKTMIIIAHRLTTVQHCDRIYLMEKGEIAKSGSYEDVVLKEVH